MFIWNSQDNMRVVTPAYILIRQVNETLETEGIYANAEELIMQLDKKQNNPAIVQQVMVLFENTEKDGRLSVVGMVMMDKDGKFSEAEKYIEYKDADFLPLEDDYFYSIYHTNKK